MIKIGDVFKNNKNQQFEIIGKCGTNKHGSKMFEIRFVETGYSTTKSSQLIKIGRIRDYFTPSVYNVGALGGEGLSSKYPKEYILWSNMLSRCYNNVSSNKDYPSYGGIGVSVSKEWLLFSNFIEDVPKIEGYNEELFFNGEIELDKDLKQKNICHGLRIYSFDNCVFVKPKENQKNRNTRKYKKRFIAINPNGDEFEVVGIVEFSKKFKLDASTITRCIKGEYKQHKGWKFKESNTSNLTTIESK